LRFERIAEWNNLPAAPRRAAPRRAAPRRRDLASQNDP